MLDMVIRHPVLATIVLVVGTVLFNLAYAAWYLWRHGDDPHALDFPRT